MCRGARFRPEQEKGKARQALVSDSQSGDEVVLNSGIFGVVKDVEGDILWIEVFEVIELKVMRGSVDGRFNAPTEIDDSDSDSDSDSGSDDGPIVG